jgi:hypothetical protein
MKQYPHSVTFNWNSPATQDEERGNMVPGEAHTITSDCRAEPNGGGRTIPSQDGTLINYSYILYLPIRQFIPAGSKAVLSIVDKELTVKSSHVGFFNTRIWL